MCGFGTGKNGTVCLMLERKLSEVVRIFLCKSLGVCWRLPRNKRIDGVSFGQIVAFLIKIEFDGLDSFNILSLSLLIEKKKNFHTLIFVRKEIHYPKCNINITHKIKGPAQRKNSFTKITYIYN